MFTLTQQYKRLAITYLSAVAFALCLPPVASAYVAALVSPPPAGAVSARPDLASQKVFVRDMLDAAQRTPEQTLWTMYPASMRGRCFGATVNSPGGAVGGGW